MATQLLRDHIIFFLGAGASRSEGYPLMSTFLDDLKAEFPWSPTDSARHKREAFETLLAFRARLSVVRDIVNTDFDNIEDLYSAAEMLAMADPEFTLDVGDRSITAKELPSQVALAIWEMCRWRPLEDRAHKAPEHHSHLMSIIKGLEPMYHGETFRRIVFVTTNYDILIELAAWHSGVPFCYGQHANFDHVLGPIGSSQSSLRVLKLHGSVNWFGKSGKTVCDFSQGTFDAGNEQGTTYEWPTIQSETPKIPEGHIPIIVPPSFSKSVAHSVLRAVWSETVAAIAKAKLLVFIGYSFPRTDTFVHQLLHVGLLENHDLRRVIVINHDPVVGKYTRRNVFNSVFSDKRLRFVCKKFDHDTCEDIRAEIQRLEARPFM